MAGPGLTLRKVLAAASESDGVCWGWETYGAALFQHQGTACPCHTAKLSQPHLCAGQFRGATPSCPGSLLQEYEDRHPYLQLHSFPHVPAQLGTQPLAPADGVAGHKCLMKQSGVICLG